MKHSGSNEAFLPLFLWGLNPDIASVAETMHFKSGPRLAGSSDVIGGAESTTNSRVSPGHRLFIMRWEENARWGHDKLAAITCAAPG